MAQAEVFSFEKEWNLSKSSLLGKEAQGLAGKSIKELELSKLKAFSIRSLSPILKGDRAPQGPKRKIFSQGVSIKRRMQSDIRKLFLTDMIVVFSELLILKKMPFEVFEFFSVKREASFAGQMMQFFFILSGFMPKNFSKVVMVVLPCCFQSSIPLIF